MKFLFTILFTLFSYVSFSQYTLAGYITSTGQGSSTIACSAGSATLAIYSVGGTITNNQAVYTSSSGGQITDFDWRGYSATNGGAITHSLQIWGDGTVRNYSTCGGSGGGGGGGGSTGFAPAPTAWGNKKKPAVIIDMSRYDFFGGGGNGIARFFDDSTSTTALPTRNPNDYYLVGTLANSAQYWGGNRGLRFIIDLAGDSNILDLNKRYIFRDTVYAWDNTFTTGGAIYMAPLDSVLLNVPYSDRWKYFARPDSLLAPFVVMQQNNGGSTGGVWRKFPTTRAVTARYIMVWVQKDITGGSANNYPDFGEISFYTTPDFDTLTIKKWENYTPVKPTRDFKDFVGVNVGTGYWSKYLSKRVGIRYYAWSPAQFDKHAGDTTTLQFDANPYNDGPIFTNTFDTLNQSGNRPYLVMQGGNQRMLTQSGATDANKVPWLNNFKDEIENPASYVRAGRFYWNFGAKFGKNTAGLTAGELNWNGDAPTGLGLNHFNEIEAENESALRSGLSELGLFWMSQMAYDGYERRFPKTGVKVSDSTMKLNMGATHYLDSNRVKGFVYYSHFFRSDSAFIWSTVNHHHYSSTAFQDRTNPATLTAEEQVGATGTPVERENFAEKLEKYQISDNKYLRSYRPWHLTEHGYDNNQQPVPNAGVAGFWSLYGAPNYVGYDSVQDKAIAMQGAFIEAFSAGVDNFVEFIMENPCLCPNNNPGVFASAGEVLSGGFDVDPVNMYPIFHVKNHLAVMLSGWTFDSKVQATGNTRIYKFRKISNSDSVCYYVRYWPLDNIGENVTLNVGSVNSGAVKKYLNFTDTPPTESAVVVTSGQVSAVSQARAQFYFFQESSTPIIINTPKVSPYYKKTE